jgi:putative chitinase
VIDSEALARIGIDGGWARALNDACNAFEIDTKGREAAWLAQCAHESSSFNTLVENLNYSAQGLLATFPRYFTPQQCADYAREPERIANRVYANRNGNGPEETGDGWLYRGRGLIQITGAANYRRCGVDLNIDLLAEPELIEQPTYAALSAAWYWRANGCNELADAGNFAGITRRINGGLTGQDDRLAWLAKAQKALA